MNNKKLLLIGTFDLLHAGHINLFYNASKLGEVHVLVTSDRINNENPEKEKIFINEEMRRKNIELISFVEKSTIYDPALNMSLEKYIIENNIDTLVYGTDYLGDNTRINIANKNNIELLFFDRTLGISSSDIRKEIKKN